MILWVDVGDGCNYVVAEIKDDVVLVALSLYLNATQKGGSDLLHFIENVPEPMIRASDMIDCGFKGNKSDYPMSTENAKWFNENRKSWRVCNSDRDDY